jgi:hypothetical protein
MHVGEISAKKIRGGIHQALTVLFYVMLVLLLHWMAMQQ